MLMRLVVDFDAPTAIGTDPSVSVPRIHSISPKKLKGRCGPTANLGKTEGRRSSTF
jgi:hypothetical protein